MEVGNPTNFIPNISELTSEHFTYDQLNDGPPSAGQITWLHHFKSLVQVFFSSLKNNFNIGTSENNYANTNIAAIGQYQLVISGNQYIGQALMKSTTKEKVIQG